MSNFTVVAFYTYSTPYEREAEGLEKTCKEHGIPFFSMGFENQGSWVENCGLKPGFLLQALKKCEGDRFVYLDADARIRKYPKLFDTLNCDLAYHYRFNRELLSGTIYFERNDTVLNIFTAWQQQQIRNPNGWDQRNLQTVIERWRHDIDIVKLPLEYTQIFDAREKTGEPVIEHMQASRQYKKLVSLPELVNEVPYEFMGMKLRRGEDGCIWISRSNPRVERALSKLFQKVDVRRWRPRVLSDNRIEDFREVFSKKPTYIVGKGPSLDHLRAEHFTDPTAPIMCLNEAIHVVEKLGLPNPLFGVQQDAKLRDGCKPSYSPIFVSCKAANYYANYEKAYIFENGRLKLPKDALSVSAALRLSGFLGTNEYRMVCFDACVTGKTSYAKAVGYDSTWGGRPSRFLDHKKRILRRTDGLKISWIIPEDHAG